MYEVVKNICCFAVFVSFPLLLIGRLADIFDFENTAGLCYLLLFIAIAIIIVTGIMMLIALLMGV